MLSLVIFQSSTFDLLLSLGGYLVMSEIQVFVSHIILVSILLDPYKRLKTTSMCLYATVITVSQVNSCLQLMKNQ